MAMEIVPLDKVGSWIRAERKRQNYTAKAMGFATDRSESNVNYIERNHSHIIFTSVLSLLDALGVKVALALEVQDKEDNDYEWVDATEDVPFPLYKDSMWSVDVEVEFEDGHRGVGRYNSEYESWHNYLTKKRYEKPVAKWRTRDFDSKGDNRR